MGVVFTTLIICWVMIIVAHQVMLRTSVGLLRDVYNDYDVAQSLTQFGAVVLFMLFLGVDGFFLWWLSSMTAATGMVFLVLGISGTALLLGVLGGMYLALLIHGRTERERVASYPY